MQMTKLAAFVFTGLLASTAFAAEGTGTSGNTTGTDITTRTYQGKPTADTNTGISTSTERESKSSYGKGEDSHKGHGSTDREHAGQGGPQGTGGAGGAGGGN